MDVGLGPNELAELLGVLGGFLATALGAYALVRRARRRRAAEIERAGEARPALDSRRRPGSPVLEPDEPQAEPEPKTEGEDGADGHAGAEAEHVRPAAREPAGAAAPKREARLGARLVAAPEADRGPDLGPAAVEETRPAPAPPITDDKTEGRAGQVIQFPIGRVVEPVEKPSMPAVPARARRKDPHALAPGLARTRSGWITRLGEVFAGKKQIDPALVDEIEKILLTADIGVRTSHRLLADIRSSLSRNEIAEPEAVWEFLRRRSAQILDLHAPPIDFGAAKPFVILVIGVNGSGKTTTIGKIAARLGREGRKVLLAAGDTFRAAATEQLEVWARRVGATVVRGKEGADPSSVIFEAARKAKADGQDVVLADTAGRLHTKTDLMEELQKVRRVIGKAVEGAPQETWLVLDATSGQNAIAQAQIFTDAMAVTGIVLTKLDGTAKGGVILGITDQLKIPVRYIGIGERVEDLREFDAEEFVEALYDGA